MKRIVGLTGPSGAGKSRAATAAAAAGFRVIDCDAAAREAVLPGTAGLRAVTQAFGADVLLPDGSLDRRALARRAFSSPENTTLLNRTLLPHIVALIRPQLADGCVLLDAPTLFESGLDAVCDVTAAVLADRALRLSRIIERDGLTLKDAELRLSAGKPDAFYLERAGHILYNNGDTAAFDAAAAELFHKIIGGHCDE